MSDSGKRYAQQLRQVCRDFGKGLFGSSDPSDPQYLDAAEDAALKAGAIIRETIKTGWLFAGDAYVGMRADIEQAAGGQKSYQRGWPPGASDGVRSSPCSDAHIFRRAIYLVLRGRDQQISSVFSEDVEKYLDRGCESIAEMLETGQTAQSKSDSPAGGGKSNPTHSDDFTSVNWFGTKYTFSKGQQAEAIKHLWDAWETDGHSLSEMNIGDKVGSSSRNFRLEKVFRIKGGKGKGQHPAWGTMVKRVNKGVFALCPPNPG